MTTNCTMDSFLQAEDGIRDYKVTGVQTCALPILREPAIQPPHGGHAAVADRVRREPRGAGLPGAPRLRPLPQLRTAVVRGYESRGDLRAPLLVSREHPQLAGGDAAARRIAERHRRQSPHLADGRGVSDEEWTADYGRHEQPGVRFRVLLEEPRSALLRHHRLQRRRVGAVW